MFPLTEIGNGFRLTRESYRLIQGGTPPSDRPVCENLPLPHPPAPPFFSVVSTGHGVVPYSRVQEEKERGEGEARRGGREASVTDQPGGPLLSCRPGRGHPAVHLTLAGQDSLRTAPSSAVARPSR